MKKRKITAMLLAAVLLSTLLFACGQSEQDKLYDELTAKKTAAPSIFPRPAESDAEKDAEVASKTPISYNHTLQYVSWGELFNLEPNLDLSGSLKIRTYYKPLIEPWAEEFMATYPNVTIELDEHPLSASDASQRLVVELNSGTAGDIVLLGGISQYKYGESGLFRDLYPFMEADSDFHMEDYYTNIFKALETRDGKLCTVTPSFTIPCFSFNTLVTDQIGVDFLTDYPDGMTYKDVAELYWRCIEEGALDAGAVLSPLGSKIYLMDLEVAAYMDEANHECNLDSPGFIEYLETAKSLPSDIALAYDGFAVDYDFAGTDEFMIRGNDYFGLLPRYLHRDEKLHDSVWVPYRTGGEKKLFEITCPVGITSACENPELAWEFVKFILSEKPFPPKPEVVAQESDYEKIFSYELVTQEPAYRKIYCNGIPVNRKNFENLCNAYWDDQELVQHVERVAEQCNTLRFCNGELLSAWTDFFQDYFEHDLISAEECAKQMQERTWIYMNE